MSKSTQLTQRPGYGTSGKHCSLKANYFEIKTIPKMIYHYDVHVTHSAPSKIQTILINEFKKKREDISKFVVLYDGNKNMYTSALLPIENELVEQISSSSQIRIVPNKPFKIRIKLVNKIKSDSLYKFIKESDTLNNEALNYLMCLDIVFKQKALENYPTFSSSYFLPENSREISGGLKVHQGFYQSCKPGSKKLFLNVDTSSTVFYPKDYLINFVYKVLELKSPQELIRGIPPGSDYKLSNFLKGLNVRVNHRKNKNLKFKIKSLSKTSAKDTKFQSEENKETNVTEYFKSKYNIHLHYPLLPCLIVQKDQHIPIEVCEIVPNQRFMKKLNDRQTADILKFSCKKPHIRFKEIKDSNSILNNQDNEYLMNFDVSLSSDFITTEGRILPTPELQYLNMSNKIFNFIPRDGCWDMRNKKFINAARLKSWGILCLGHPREMPKHQVQFFLKELMKMCNFAGIIIQNRDPVIEFASIGNLESGLKKLYKLTEDSVKARPQLLIIILSFKSLDIYAEIKRICDVNLGVTSQCIVSKNITAPKPQYCSNVSLKINAKLGGFNTFIESKNLNFINSKPTIICGADISNPGPGINGVSVASLVGSLDKKLCTWGSTTSKQPPKEDIIVNIKNMMKSILIKFKNMYKFLPKQILFYRDGVSDGQFKIVKNLEIKAIREICAELGGKDTRITFVVVKKRHHTRFMSLNRQFQDRSGNCLPGTVIDKDITHPNEFDFFLFSHSGIQGTSKPTHYHVLQDDNKFNPDELQTLTYNLCYLYVRCPRSVSLVTPVYYAHLLGTRVRLHHHNSGDIQDYLEEKEFKDSYPESDSKDSLCTQLYFV